MRCTLHRFTYIDLFAGAGGLSLGFENIGAKGLLAIEQDLWAAETYAYNKPEVNIVTQDIQRISDEEIRKYAQLYPDAIIGGPPCQGFSHSAAGKKDPKDPRNSLFNEFMRFAAIIRPRICVMENVPGLLKTRMSNGKYAIEAIISSFKEIGYFTHFRCLDAQDYGVPQKRERLFIIAIENSLNANFFSWPEPTHSAQDKVQLSLFKNEVRSIKKHVSLWEAIQDLPQIYSNDSMPNDIYSAPATNDFQKLMREKAVKSLENHEPMRHTARVSERFRAIGIGQSEADVPAHLKPRKRGYEGESTGYDQNSRRQRPDMPCSTIVASSHTNYIHPFLHRNFTVREMMRIQSFPDWFIARGKRAVLSKKLSLRKGLVDEVYLDQRAQIGNAVPPLLAAAIGKSCADFLEQERMKNAS